MSEFKGFPVEALDFYDDLELNNTKSFWEANKHIWAESVKAPMTAPPTIWRPNSVRRRSSSGRTVTSVS